MLIKIMLNSSHRWSFQVQVFFVLNRWFQFSPLELKLWATTSGFQASQKSANHLSFFFLKAWDQSHIFHYHKSCKISIILHSHTFLWAINETMLQPVRWNSIRIPLEASWLLRKIFGRKNTSLGALWLRLQIPEEPSLVKFCPLGCISRTPSERGSYWTRLVSEITAPSSERLDSYFFAHNFQLLEQVQSFSN